MVDGNVYYCWSCDAHRRVRPDVEGRAACPRCGEELAADARLSATRPAVGPILRLDRPVAPQPPRRPVRASA